MKYIKPQLKAIILSSQATMATGSLLGGNTNTQLGKERNDIFEEEETEAEW